ncbi:MAG: mechanosensitive ion channel family protein [Candidatus Cryptobacteroides sp.]
MLPFLQVTPEQIDSLDKHLKTQMETMVETIQTTPADELLADLMQKAIQFGIKVVIAIIIYIVGAWLIKVIKRALGKMFVRRNTDKTISSFVMSLVSITLTVLLIIITISTLGINTTSLAAILAAGGMAIGMALSGTVQNFAGGIILLIFKPFKAGDFITAQGVSGTVSEVNIVSTKLVTTDNRVIVIPNGALSNGMIDNYSQKDIRRAEWLVDVEYGSSSNDVRAVLAEIAKEDPRVLGISTGAPADPMIELNALRDSSVQFIMRVWVKSDDYWQVIWDFNERIYNELPKRGILFPFPQLDIHIDKD